MQTSEDYRQMANGSAQLAIACFAPSVAGALLALALDYMALADGLGAPASRGNRNNRKRSKILPASEIRFTGRPAVAPFKKYAPQTGRMWA